MSLKEIDPFDLTIEIDEPLRNALLGDMLYEEENVLSKHFGINDLTEAFRHYHEANIDDGVDYLMYPDCQLIVAAFDKKKQISRRYFSRTSERGYAINGSINSTVAFKEKTGLFLKYAYGDLVYIRLNLDDEEKRKRFSLEISSQVKLDIFGSGLDLTLIYDNTGNIKNFKIDHYMSGSQDDSIDCIKDKTYLKKNQNHIYIVRDNRDSITCSTDFNQSDRLIKNPDGDEFMNRIMVPKRIDISNLQRSLISLALTKEPFEAPPDADYKWRSADLMDKIGMTWDSHWLD